MSADKMQAQRYELKYLVTEDVALAARDFVRSYLECDEFGATLPNLSYPVHSVYLDSYNLATYHWTFNGDKNRYKLRLRYYDDKPESPVFFEVKKRTDNTISKMRGGVRREAVADLLAGQYPLPTHLLSKDPKQFVALQRFCALMSELNAGPKAHNCYLREAWISPYDNSVRVTMDRNVQIEPDPSWRVGTAMRNPAFVFGRNVVLELKFTNRFPDWFGDLVRTFGLMQCGAAKYAMGLELIGLDRVMNSFAFDDPGPVPQDEPSPSTTGAQR